MPCRYDENPELEASNLREAMRHLRKELDLVTRLLCSTCKQLENSPLAAIIDTTEDGELKEWWEEHKIADARREAQERQIEEQQRVFRELEAQREIVRQQALLKLTSEERAALGFPPAS